MNLKVAIEAIKRVDCDCCETPELCEKCVANTAIEAIEKQMWHSYPFAKPDYDKKVKGIDELKDYYIIRTTYGYEVGKFYGYWHNGRNTIDDEKVIAWKKIDWSDEK